MGLGGAARRRAFGMVPVCPSGRSGCCHQEGEEARSDRLASPRRGSGGNVHADPGTGRRGLCAFPAAGMNAGTGSRLQGRDDIVVHAPARILWQLISDSHELPDWGPPVRSVEVMTNAADAEM